MGYLFEEQTNITTETKMKILFFTETLYFGGKERRLLELIYFLKKTTDHEIVLALTEDQIHYDYVYELDIPIVIIKRKWTKYDPVPFIRFYNFCREFKPDIIHSWGRLTTFYSIPSKILCRIPLVSSMIADSNRGYGVFTLKYFSLKVDILFANVILSNSRAGLKAYGITNTKAKVILNGVNLERFQMTYNTDEVKKEIGLKTTFTILMVAAFTGFKDYNLFLDVAKIIGKSREDVTFVGVGDGPELQHIQQRVKDEMITNVLLTGSQRNVERIIAASDIGLLCTYSEGISNSIIEYMALGKPVISTDLNGGSRELIIEGETGYCIERNADKISAALIFLINSSDTCISMGKKGRERILNHFSITRMGTEFCDIYTEVLKLGRPGKHKELYKPMSNIKS